eukprot:809679_1
MNTIMSKIKFSEDSAMDVCIKTLIQNDLSQNFVFCGSKFPRLDKANAKLSANYSGAKSLILTGQIKRNAADPDLNILIENGESLCDKVLCFKITNDIDQAQNELKNN